MQKAKNKTGATPLDLCVGRHRRVYELIDRYIDEAAKQSGVEDAIEYSHEDFTEFDESEALRQQLLSTMFASSARGGGGHEAAHNE